MPEIHGVSIHEIQESNTTMLTNRGSSDWEAHGVSMPVHDRAYALSLDKALALYHYGSP